MSIFRIKRRFRVLLLFGSSAGIAGLGVLGVVDIGANAYANSVGVSTQAMSQVSRLCTSASQQVQVGTAGGFMQWINNKCNSEGAGSLTASAGNNAAPLGALICQYAAGQVQAGKASPMDKSQAQLCKIKPLPTESGILSQPSAPPSGSGITVTNAWAGTLNGQRELVYAGAQSATLNNGDHGNPQQGVVLVANLGTSTYQTYPSSGLDGALTIASATGTSLSLTAADGSSYTFDVSSNTLTKTK